jgi:hypothetical protein
VDNPASIFLFHRPEFIFRHPEDQIITFEVSGAKIYFSRVGNLLTSLAKSPFGSFVLTSRSTKAELNSLVEKIALWSNANGIANLMIRSFPETYQPHHTALIKDVLIDSGFNVIYADITQAIHVTEEESMNLDTHKKRRVRQAKSLEFGFRQIPLSYLDEAYSLIVESRESKGYPVTMTLKDLEATLKLFPSDYLLFGVFDQKKLIATSVSIKVNNEILYCFYIGDALAYRHYSPVTLLIDGIFEYCKTHHFKMLDLGISTDKGVLNKGLYTFKKSFGAFDSPKLTFLKQL